MNTHWALLKTTAIELDPHRSRFGAMIRARFTLVILVAASTRSSRKSCKKLMTKSTTRRLAVGSRSTAVQQASASLANAIQSLYISEGTSGSTNSRSQSLNNDAGTCGSSTPSSVYEPRSSRILSAATASESPGTRKIPSAFVPPRARTPSARNGSTMGTFCFGYVRSCKRKTASSGSPNVDGLNAASCKRPHSALDLHARNRW